MWCSSNSSQSSRKLSSVLRSCIDATALEPALRTSATTSRSGRPSSDREPDAGRQTGARPRDVIRRQREPAASVPSRRSRGPARARGHGPACTLPAAGHRVADQLWRCSWVKYPGQPSLCRLHHSRQRRARPCEAGNYLRLRSHSPQCLERSGAALLGKVKMSFRGVLGSPARAVNCVALHCVFRRD